MEYLILRRLPSDSGLVGDGYPVGIGSGIQPLIQDLPQNEIRGLHRDPNVIIAARSMPLQLIEPISSAELASSKDPAPNAVDEPTWGIRTVKADTSGFAGNGVVVAVLDTGIDKYHAAFAGINIIGRNFCKNPSDSAIDPDAFEDTHGHGTHCAGTIFGRSVAGKRIGVAPGVTDVAIGKVLGPDGGSTGTLASAMNWAIDNHAQIISMSLGMDPVGFRGQLVAEGVHEKKATWEAMQTLVDNMRFFDKFSNFLRSGTPFGRSAVVVAASGNESDRFGKRLEEGAYVLGPAYPANAEDFLSVGAIEESGDHPHTLRVAEFSNTPVRLAAPGVDVISAAAGPNHKALRIGSGTSMATPHVAGVAALWTQKLALIGQATANRVAFELQKSAIVPCEIDETDIGYGIPQAPQA